MIASEKVKCAYCRRERFVSEMIKGKIVYPSRDNYGRAIVSEEYNWYCKDSVCYGNDRMAHEG